MLVPGAPAERVTRSGGVDAQESVDGQYLYYVKQPGPRLFRMPVAGGEEQQVVPEAMNGWGAFGVTAKGVYFQTGPTIKFVDAVTGKVSTVADVPRGWYSGSLCVSPDDRYVVYEKLERNTTDLMLVEHFR